MTKELKFSALPPKEKEISDILEAVKERGVTVKEIQELMRKLDIPGASEVTSKNKNRYIQILLKKLNELSRCELLKRVKLEIKEETYNKCGEEEIIIKRRKSKIESDDLAPSTDIHSLSKKYLEKNVKKPDFS